ncbi:MAG: rRNA maturation RNase YbeY [Pseudomonadales bacterium]|nr:rRNA maturation RNase YbeY [Pseudomonadales bacterium]
MPVDVQFAVVVADLPDASRIEEWVIETMRAVAVHQPEAHAGEEVCIRVVDEAESRDLNHRYRHRDRSTNVLSFPADLDLPDPAHPITRILGDIVVCAPVVIAEALQQGKTITEHFAHMVVHGMLHLYGYDHQVESDADVMEQLEREILGRFSIGDPYRETEPA